MNLNGRLSSTGSVHGSMGASLVANVEANPAGAASEILTKIRVGDTIFKIPSGGGGGGVTSYSLLSDKPKINNHTIDGDMTSANLDLQDKIVFPGDGTKYLDGNGNFSTPDAGGVNYSTSEQDTGLKWIDDRPIYQKTWILTIPNTSGGYLFPDTDITNLDIIVDAYYGLNKGPRHYVSWYTNYNVLFDQHTASGVEFYFGSNAQAGSTLIYTAKYVKSV